MLKLIIAAFLTCLLPLALPAQMEQTADPYEQKFQWRIQQERLNGVYIPRDLNDALLTLNRLIDKPSKKKFLSISEEEAAHKLFFSLGRWMTHNWSFYDGSRLSVYLQKMGIYDPGDMSRFLIILLHRSLNKQPLEVKSLAERFEKQEELRKKERLLKGTIIYEEKKLIPPPKKGGNQKN
ncbi:MAG: DUF6794 domain-containing protein [Saprospiraceae bacterium]